MKVEEILEWLEGQGYAYAFTGKTDVEIEGFSSLANYRENTITWIKNEKNYHNAGRIDGVACAVVQRGVKTDYTTVIEADNSKEVFFAILRNFWEKSGWKEASEKERFCQKRRRLIRRLSSDATARLRGT